MLLTIGMATYDDHPGTWFTLTLLHHQLINLGRRDDVQIVVVDNKPDSDGSSELRKLCADIGAKYVPQASPVGTGPARERIFQEAIGEWVLVMDSHVWLMDWVPARLFDFLQDNPSQDFWQGVCRRSKLWQPGYKRHAITWTHWEGRWGEDGLFGKSATKPGAGDPAFIEQPAFEIPYGGLGLFMCRKDAWLGFHPRFRGFGVEGYLQAKWRAAGRTCWCLPWLHWVHCFQPRGKAIRPNKWPDRTNNYLWWHHELQTILLTDLKRHHVQTAGRTTQKEWQKLLGEVGINEREVLAKEAAAAGDLQQPEQTARKQTARLPHSETQRILASVLTESDTQTAADLDCRFRGRQSGMVLCNKGCPASQSEAYPTYDCRRHGLVVLNSIRTDIQSCVACKVQKGDL